MKNSKHHIDTRNHLKHFCENRLTFKARVALLSSYNTSFSRRLEASLIIFEYLQLVSQIILFLPDLSEVSNHRLLFQIIIYTCKLIDPSHLLSFENTDSTIQSILTLLLSFTVLKYSVLVSIIAIAYWDIKDPPRTLITTWRFIFKTQGRISCYFVTSFWVRAIIQIKDTDFKLYAMHKAPAITLLSFLWAIEYLSSFLLEIQFCDILPRKNFLSGKNFHLQLITLTEKMVVQMLQLCMKGNLKSRLWVSAVLVGAFSIIRVQTFFTTLPLYQMEALLLQSKLNSIVLALSISQVFQAILLSANYSQPRIEFLIITGFVLSLLLTKFSQELLKGLIARLFSTPKMFKNSPDLLIHKVVFLKQLFQAERLPTPETAKYHWTLLATTIINNTLGDETNKTPLEQIEKLSLKFPKHKLTQLYFSHLGIKNLKISSKASKTIASLMKKPWSPEYTSAFFLLCKFRESLIKDRDENKKALDLTHFVKCQKYLSGLKEKMGKQAEMQVSICQNILAEKCDIGEIFDKAQNVAKLRRTINKEADLLSAKMPESCLEYFLVCAKYYLVLEFSQINCQKYWENYYLKYFKYKKFFQSPNLLEENLYQASNAFLVLVGQNKNNGTVKYCSRSLEKVLGGECQEYISSHVSSLFLPSLQVYYRNLFRQIFENNQGLQLLDNVQKVFLCHKKGYIVKSQIFLQVHPDPNENIYISMIIRNSSTPHPEYIILKGNGDIEGATKKISNQLGLKSNSSVNIQQVSEELHDFFSSDGKEITLKSLIENASYIYYCKMKLLNPSFTGLKVIELSSRTNKKVQSLESIKSEELKSFQIPLEIMPSEGFHNHDHFALTTEGNYVLTTERNLISPRNPKIPFKPETKRQLSESTNPSQGEKLADFLSVTTTTFKKAQEKAVYKSYRNNINQKSYSKSFSFFCLAFYGVILATLFVQVTLKTVYDQTMDDLVIRKDLLSYAQFRSFYASKLCFTFNGYFGLTLGVNVWTMPGGFDYSPSIIFATLPTYYNGLFQANNKILNLLDKITEENIKTQLFKNDVRINGSYYNIDDQTTFNTTSFEAVDLVVSASQYLITVTDPGADTSKPIYDFIRGNSQDDFLAKNMEITQLFQESVNSQRNSLKHLITLFLAVTPLLLAGMAILLTGIIWRQYSLESAYLRAFIKLDPRTIKSLSQDMEIFKNALQNNLNFEDKKLIEFFWNHSNATEREHLSARHSRHDTQIIDYLSLQKRYFRYFIQVVIFVSILIAILLWNFISANHHADIIYNRQSQLQLSNSLSEQVTIAIQGVVEIFVTNNTGSYVHQLPSDFLEAAFVDLKTLQQKLITGLQELDGTYDPQIQTYLFKGVSCSDYASYFPSYCTYLESNGVLTNTVNLMSYFRSFLEDKYQQFYTSDQSSFAALFETLFQGVTAVTMASSLICFHAQLMNAIINTNLTQSISQASDTQTEILIVFGICLILVSLLIWIKILKRIKEVRNDFKKVLQVLPPKLVLSSFLLKQFLNQASGIEQDI